jgi:crotonobetainyl-CoA:carnitine CoA-transferase CaiB-like acyl-CoA transferase
MFALFARERTGRGQHVDVSYLDTSLALLAATPNMRFFWSDGQAPKRGEGFLGGSYPYYAIYDTKDNRQITICCTEPWLWANFCKAIDRPDFVRFARQPDQFVRAANADEVGCREAIEGIIRTRTRDEWYDYLAKADVCVGKVYDPEEMVKDPQVLSRDMIVEMHHPQHGPVKQFGQPIKLSDTPAAMRTAAPASGEHTDEVLRELGLTTADIKAMREKRIVA